MNLRTPRGVKDFLPLEAEWKLELERKIRSVFHRWGYQEVISPTFEFYDLFAQGSGDQRQAYRFFDQNGDLLVLRSDLTTPIARMVATRLKDEAKPLRLGYIANVFRYDEVQVGFQREFYQAGVELLGAVRRRRMRKRRFGCDHLQPGRRVRLQTGPGPYWLHPRSSQ